MADKKQETIEDVVRKIRNEIAELRRVSPNVRSIAADWWEARADEIEAAHKRERVKIEADALEVGGIVGASRATADKSSAVGDAAKLREACANIAEYARSAQCHTEDAHVLDCLNQIEGWAKAALAAPVKNCEVGTPEEQMKRQHDTMCNTTKACPDSDWSCRKCFAEWAQMPYEEGGADGAAT